MTNIDNAASDDRPGSRPWSALRVLHVPITIPRLTTETNVFDVTLPQSLRLPWRCSPRSHAAPPNANNDIVLCIELKGG